MILSYWGGGGVAKEALPHLKRIQQSILVEAQLCIIHRGASPHHSDPQGDGAQEGTEVILPQLSWKRVRDKCLRLSSLPLCLLKRFNSPAWTLCNDPSSRHHFRRSSHLIPVKRSYTSAKTPQCRCDHISSDGQQKSAGLVHAVVVDQVCCLLVVLPVHPSNNSRGNVDE